MSYVRVRAWVAAVTCAAFVGTGCGGPAWAPAAAVADPGAVTGVAAPRTIDVLPLDVEVWGETPDIDVGQVRLGIESWLVGGVTSEMYARGLQVGAVMDWSGAFVSPDGVTRSAMAPVDLEGTINSLARYGERIPPPPADLPVPYLPARLGTATGADATLYVGGWGYAGAHHDGTGEKIAKGIGIALVAVIIVVAVVAMAKGGGGNGLGNVAGAAANGAAHVAVSAGRVALHVAGNVMIDTVRVASHMDGDTLADVLDAMGHAHSTAEITSDEDHPDWSNDGGLPHHGNSAMFIEMTLVDNHTGLVLWHAQQREPADPRHQHDVTRLTKALLATFPAPVRV
jgi:hypothetical protein